MDLVQSKILSPVRSTRQLRLLSLHGHGFRRIGTAAEEVTRTPLSRYAETVPWAHAAHAAGFDGIAWMSRHHDTSRAYVFFGDPTGPGDFVIVPSCLRATGASISKDGWIQ